MEKDELKFITPAENCKCKTCALSSVFKLDSWCAAFKIKPDVVLFEGKDCPRYLEDPNAGDD